MYQLIFDFFVSIMWRCEPVLNDLSLLVIGVLAYFQTMHIFIFLQCDPKWLLDH